MSRYSLLLLLLFGLQFFALSCGAQPDAGRYLVEIELHTEAELLDALQRTDQLFEDGMLSQGTPTPVRFVLHGPEVYVLLRQNYRQHKPTVDLAARLSALGLVDMKVCETWMGRNRVDPADLPPFVGTVPFGPAEKRRLLEEANHVRF